MAEPTYSWKDDKGYYNFSITLEDGTRIHTSSKVSLNRAKDAAYKKRRDIRTENALIKLDLNSYDPFGDWVSLYMHSRATTDNTKSRWTAVTYKKHLSLMEAFLGSSLSSVPMRDVTKEKCLKFYKTIVSGEDVKRFPEQKKVREILMLTCSFAERKGVISGDNPASVPLPETEHDEDLGEIFTKEILTDEEILKLHKGAETGYFRYGYAYELMLLTGITNTELVALKDDDITDEYITISKRIIILRKKNRHKGSYTANFDDVRRIRLDPLMLNCIKEQRRIQESRGKKSLDGFFIYSPAGSRVSRDGFVDGFHRFCAMYGISVSFGDGLDILARTFYSKNRTETPINPVLAVMNKDRAAAPPSDGEKKSEDTLTKALLSLTKKERHELVELVDMLEGVSNGEA